LNKKILLIGLVAIIAGSMLIDYYADLLYPLVELGELTVPDLEVGESSRFDFFKDDSMVGSYTYSIVEVDELGAGKTYTTRHMTEVSYGGESILLEGLYRFDSSYKPIWYSLNATTDEGVQTIMCSFNPGSVTISLTYQGTTTELTQELPEGAVLVENSMPGYWELLFRSTTFEHGKRYSVDALVPQAGRVVHLTLVVEKDLSQERVGDQVLECTVIKDADYSLTFYIYNGEFVQYRDEAQGVLLRKVS
jgi:hypothetical protein